MKPDERVSDDRLAFLLDDGKLAIHNERDCGDEEYLQFLRDKDAALTELQQRRAADQAELPAVEEMASKTRNAVLAVYSPVGTFELRVDAAIADTLAPLYAQLAEYAKVLGECREYMEEIHYDRDTGTILNRIDALLVAKGGEDVVR